VKLWRCPAANVMLLARVVTTPSSSSSTDTRADGRACVPCGSLGGWEHIPTAAALAAAASTWVPTAVVQDRRGARGAEHAVAACAEGTSVAGHERARASRAAARAPCKGWDNVNPWSGKHHTRHKTWLPDALLRSCPSPRARSAPGAGCPTPSCGL
jgi:hypothetical protein